LYFNYALFLRFFGKIPHTIERVVLFNTTYFDNVGWNNRLKRGILPEARKFCIQTVALGSGERSKESEEEIPLGLHSCLRSDYSGRSNMARWRGKRSGYH
jgi:hypothetical protein